MMAGFLILWTILAASVSPASAWGPLGHKVVARIAESQLDPRARSQIRAILGEGVSLEDIAGCADAIKHNLSVRCGTPEMSFLLEAAPETESWHYVKIPITARPELADLAAYCGPHCVISETRRWLSVLEDPQSSRSSKQEALMFVVHFVGDIHQPLHCATAPNPDGGDDHVALRAPVTFMGKPTNLHYLWDRVVGVQKKLGPDYAGDPAQIEDTTEALEQDLVGRDTGSWAAGDVIGKAVLESFALAQGAIYPDYRHNKDLGAEYQRRMLPIASERMEQAGVRLAFLLNRAFSRRP